MTRKAKDNTAAELLEDIAAVAGGAAFPPIDPQDWADAEVRGGELLAAEEKAATRKS